MESFDLTSWKDGIVTIQIRKTGRSCFLGGARDGDLQEIRSLVLEA